MKKEVIMRGEKRERKKTVIEALRIPRPWHSLCKRE